MAESRQELERALLGTLQELDNLNAIVEDYQEDSQPALMKKMDALVQHFQTLDRLKDSANIQIPVEILKFLEKETDNNPELYTKHKLEECEKKSKGLARRIKGLQALHDSLVADIDWMDSKNQ